MVLAESGGFSGRKLSPCHCLLLAIWRMIAPDDNTTKQYFVFPVATVYDVRPALFNLPTLPKPSDAIVTFSYAPTRRPKNRSCRCEEEEEEAKNPTNIWDCDVVKRSFRWRSPQAGKSRWSAFGGWMKCNDGWTSPLLGVFHCNNWKISFTLQPWFRFVSDPQVVRGTNFGKTCLLSSGKQFGRPGPAKW